MSPLITRRTPGLGAITLPKPQMHRTTAKMMIAQPLLLGSCCTELNLSYENKETILIVTIDPYSDSSNSDLVQSRIPPRENPQDEGHKKKGQDTEKCEASG